MRKLLSLVAALLFLTVPLTAQPTIAVEWNHEYVTPAEAQSYIHTYYLDSAAGQVLTGVVCRLVDNVTTCRASFPSPTIGLHTLSIDARNEFGVSPKSAPIQFRYPAIPGAPLNLRIIRGEVE